jgi:Zn ribbon nucleic-acid-binding protein
MVEDDARCPKCGRVMRLVMRRAGGRIVTHRECDPCGFTTERPPVLEEPGA